MCLGIPLRVQKMDSADCALCTDEQAPDGARRVATVLLDRSPQVDDWLLVHIDVAVRALDPAEAQLIGDALQAVSAAARGQPFEHLLGDLADREPELPPHLRPITQEDCLDV